MVGLGKLIGGFMPEADKMMEIQAELDATRKNEPEPKTLCIYHGNCADGFGAAWIVRKAFWQNHGVGSDIEFYPGVYQQEPPDCTGLNVIIVDFSYKRPIMEKIVAQAKSLVLLDHHKSAVEDLTPMFAEMALVARKCFVTESGTGNEEYRLACGFKNWVTFDLNHSGAMLAWKHYFPMKEPPALIKHIEDRDLWKFSLPGTREIQAAVFSYPYDFEVWTALMEGKEGDLLNAGKAIERKHFKDIEEFLKVAQHSMTIAGWNVPVLNCPYFWSSDAGHMMAKAYKDGTMFSACYWDQPDGRVFSLRSCENGMDVSDIAKQYGGGGHKNAAGFKIPHARADIFGIRDAET